ncbi:MAG: heme-binding protein [Herminiimonas sp.]|nr:heme-binding protein [Herminiimonas sp.]
MLSVAPGWPAAAADLKKTLHVMLSDAETGLDPATASDASTLSINENIFDSLLRYDYLARPVRLQPNTLTAMPEVSADGLTYIFRLQPGIHFSADPAFGNRTRELTAADYVYSIKRLYDPVLRSPWLFMFEHKLLGDEALLPALTAGTLPDRFDIDTPIAGLQALDRYTLQIRLRQPDHNLLFSLATPATGAVAREVLEAHTAQPGSHPVGTGPYRVVLWQRNDRIVLEANPVFRRTIFTGQGTPADSAIMSALRGKQLPLIGRIDIKIMEEQQARVLAFLNGEFDYLEPLPAPLADMALEAGQLKSTLRQRGIVLSTAAPLRTFYLWMNMEDPVVGGYTADKIALRRAIGLAYDQAEDIRVLDHGMALAAQSPLPPDVLGYDPAYRNSRRYDPVLAAALLERFGYRRRGADIYRSLPDGRPLTLQMHSLASTTGRLRDEFWRRSLEAIGIRVIFKSDRFVELIKASRLGSVQMLETNWIADYPDGENFLQLLYGGNVGRANYARFRLPQYDRLYDQARRLPDSPERTALYRQMNQLIDGYAPWVVRTHPLEATLLQPWLRNYKRHPVEATAWRYLDIDTAAVRR